jgi:DNA-binding response OmpR family regulator
VPNNLLLVDDDENLLKSFKLILESQGFKVDTAANPYHALQIMKENDIDLAILDFNLPYMSGTQLGYLIKKIKKNTPIMFISGNPEIHEITKKVKYDVCTVLLKPINPVLLIQSVVITLNGVTSDISLKTVALKEPNQVTRLINNITKIISPSFNFTFK